MFRVYKLDLFLNEIHFDTIWIDPHYEVKHGSSVNDDLILDLLFQIRNESVTPSNETHGFRYYEIDIERRKKNYRLILVIPFDNSYVGVRNAYRRSK